MPLSNIYTVDDFWREAIRDINSDSVIAFNFEKYNLINRVCEITQGLMADVVSEAYMTDVTPILSTVGKYGTTGSYVASTKILTATMNVDFSASDVGNMIILRSGTSVYVGTILSVTSPTVVKLYGDNLPTSNKSSFDTITVASTTLSSNVLDFSTAGVLRYGGQINVQLLSSVTPQVVAYSREGFTRWISSSPSNKNTIIWTIVGSAIHLSKGSSLTSYGTLTIRFPRLPYSVSISTDYIDMLDGSMMQVGISLLRSMIQKRMNIPVDVDKNLIADQISAVYRSLNGEIKKEEILSKVESLV